MPGKAYQATGWELWATVWPLYEAGKYDEAADRASELIGPDSPYPNLLFNLACVESLAGRKEAALEHLGQAVERSEELRALAREDSDLDAIRDEPRFKELVGEELP
jgi:tetratricopeptide (TPR) repeat protein